jgi:hypothetical protein
MGNLRENMRKMLKWLLRKLYLKNEFIWIRTGTNGGLGFYKKQEMSSLSEIIKNSASCNKLNLRGCYELGTWLGTNVIRNADRFFFF